MLELRGAAEAITPLLRDHAGRRRVGPAMGRPKKAIWIKLADTELVRERGGAGVTNSGLVRKG